MTVEISDAEKVARLVIMFHQGGEWSPDRRELWRAITGTDEATTKVLCDFARAVLRRCESGGAP